MTEKRGLKIRAKRGILAAKGGAKRAYLGPQKHEKRRFLAFQRANLGSARDFMVVLGQYVIVYQNLKPPLEIT
jgi:hypothetical protein